MPYAELLKQILMRITALSFLSVLMGVLLPRDGISESARRVMGAIEILIVIEPLIGELYG